MNTNEKLLFWIAVLQIATFIVVAKIYRILKVDFTKEDESVRRATEQIKEAQKRIPPTEKGGE